MDAGTVIGIIGTSMTVVNVLILVPLRSDIKDLRDRDKEFVAKDIYDKDHTAQEKVNSELFKRTRDVELKCAKNHGGRAYEKC